MRGFGGFGGFGGHQQQQRRPGGQQGGRKVYSFSFGGGQ